MTPERSTRSVRRLLPITEWLPRYDRSWLRGDLMAGIAVTALVVPKNLGYAGIAGVPLENGLYAAAAGAIIYALFCTSRQISTGPSSSLAAVAGGAVLATRVGGQDAAQLVAAITLVTGGLFLLLALFRLGWIARFLSKAVITGFLAGAAIDVTIGELSKLTGTSSSGDSAWRELWTWFQGLDEIHWTTLSGSRPRLPGVILGLVVRGAVGPRRASCSWSAGSSRIWAVRPRRRRRWRQRRARSPRAPQPGAPRLGPRPDPPRDDRHRVGRAAAPHRFLADGFGDARGVCDAASVPHRGRQPGVGGSREWRERRGRALPGHAGPRRSLSASSLNESAGARTPVASLITGGLVLLTLIVLAPLFSALPKAVLAAVIIDAVVFGMIDVAELRRLRRVARIDFWIAVAAIVGVLSAGVLAGVTIGIALSLVWLIYVATSPKMPLLGREPGTQAFRELDEYPGDETFPGIAVLRLDSGLFFATAEALDDRVRAVIRESEPRLDALVLDFEGVDFVDSQGAAKLAELLEVARTDDIALRLARLKPQVRSVLDADGLTEALGADRIHGNVDRAIEAELTKPA